MATIQARSRLRIKTKYGTPIRPETARAPNSAQASNVAKQQLNKPLSKIGKRGRYWPLLVLSICFYLSMFWLLHYVHPALIEDLLFNDSYLPLQIIFFLGNFFALTFISLDRKIGLSTAIFIGIILFFRLQRVQLDYLSLGTALMMSVALFWLTRKL